MATEWKKVKFNQIFAEPTRNGLSETSSKENDGLKIINMGEVFGYDFISCKQEMRKLPSNKRVNSAFVVKNNDLLSHNHECFLLILDLLHAIALQ